jgi:hypothetical protein
MGIARSIFPSALIVAMKSSRQRTAYCTGTYIQ